MSARIGVVGLAIVGLILYANRERMAGPSVLAEPPPAASSDAVETPNDGAAACDRAANPPSEARIPHDAADSINDLTAVVEGITDGLDVSNIQHDLDEATLDGNAEQINKLRADLQAAKRVQIAKAAEINLRLAVAKVHEQVLKDIADCRKFRGED